MQPILHIEKLSKQFGGIVAIKDVTLEVEKGLIVSIIGPNGAGKTTFFNLITGFYIPDSGHILFEDKRVEGLPPHRLAKAGIARTFQNIRLFPWMTVQDNLIVARRAKCKSGLFDALIQSPRNKKEEKESKAEVEQILAYFQLDNKRHYQAKNLSYGEQRRLEIARALALEPKILLLDEPTAGMNPAESENCVDSIFNLNEETGITVILIEHNMNVVMGISDRIMVLDHGEKIAEGIPEEIQRDENVIRAYLGEDYFGVT
jgi:branched-chain amino acid transport system ATP-binding protein